MAKAPQTDDDAPKKKRRGASVMAWVLMAMIVGGLGGFGVTNFGGGITTIGSVGDREISIDSYSRALQQQINAFSQQVGQPIGFSQAQALGIDRKVLQDLVNSTALDNENDRIGLSVGDATVASKISGISAFQGVAGGFDRDAYRQTLQRNNMTEAGFESDLRADMARQILQSTVSAGFTTPAVLTTTLANWVGEQRSFSLLRLDETDLTTPLPAATDADLNAYYTAHIDSYTRPEAKRITYAALLPETIAKDMLVDEAELEKTYQDKINDYVVPEKRLVERLAFATDADAAAAKARLDAGETFEALVAERQLTLEDVDMGDVSKSDLGAAGDAVFALTEPGVVGPLPSDIGPALFRMNAILAAQETPFESVRDDLALEVQLAAARAAITAKVEAVDDLLAGGATLEEVAKEQGMTLATTEYAAGADDNDAIAAYAAFQTAADKLGEGDFPEAIVLDDGGLIAMQMDATVPPTPVPFDKVKDKVAAAAHADALAKALSAQAETIKTAVAGGAELASFGIVETTSNIDRQGSVPNVPDDFLTRLFAMKPGETAVVDEAGFAGIVTLNTITAAPTEGEDATATREAIDVNAAKAISADAMSLFTAALVAEAGIHLDQTAINSVNARMNN
jgi:peptidyl-prolyl cis-trans isomerase D